MTAMHYFCLLAVPALLSAGQVLFKKTAQDAALHSPMRFLLSLAGNGYFWAALLLYGIATLLWIWILSRVPLTRAMPFVALTFAVVPLFSIAVFGERINLHYWLGVGVILAGIYITTAAVQSGG